MGLLNIIINNLRLLRKFHLEACVLVECLIIIEPRRPFWHVVDFYIDVCNRPEGRLPLLIVKCVRIDGLPLACQLPLAL